MNHQGGGVSARVARARELLVRGYEHVNSDDKGPALGYFDRALEVAASLDDPRLGAETHTARGIALLFRGDNEAALTAFEASLEQARVCGVAYLEADAWHNVGLARQRSGRHEAALHALEHAVQMFERQEAPSALPITWHTIARCHAALERRDAALAAYDRAVDVAARLANHRELTQAALGRALLQRRSGMRGDAESSLELAIGAQQRLGTTRLQRRLRLKLALWRLRRWNVAGALAALARPGT